MTIWKDGGNCGRIYREIVNEDESHVIAKVRTGRSAPYRPAINPVRPWPEGEENFRLILQAPQMLEALEMIRKAPTYKEYSEGGEETYHSLYLTDSQLAQIDAAIVAAKGDETKT